MKHVYYYDTPLGKVGIGEEGGAVTNLFFQGTVAPKDFRLEETPLLKEAHGQLQAFFRRERTAFSLPLAPEGTPFQRQVWDALLTIPFGETRSYGQIAAQIGRPTASRAVGAANGRNPISVFIPCHRVIGTGGALTGYAGGLDAKTLLLTLEGVLPGK